MTRYSAEVTELFEKQNLYPVYQINSSDPEEFIPYDVIAPHEAQALRNHAQTLHRLAERGGLDWGEILAILTGRSRSTAFEVERNKAKTAVLNIIEDRKAVQDDTH